MSKVQQRTKKTTLLRLLGRSLIKIKISITEAQKLNKLLYNSCVWTIRIWSSTDYIIDATINFSRYDHVFLNLRDLIAMSLSQRSSKINWKLIFFVQCFVSRPRTVPSQLVELELIYQLQFTWARTGQQFSSFGAVIQLLKPSLKPL